jgi:hypothetical protein
MQEGAWTTMQKKLATIGSSKGVILDRTLLALLGLEEEDDAVSITVQGHRLILERAYAGSRPEAQAAPPRDLLELWPRLTPAMRQLAARLMRAMLND